MGTTWSVKVISGAFTSADKLREGIQAQLDLVNHLMSNWDPESEVSQFNKSPAGCYDISSDTHKVVEVSLQLSELTDGLFDVTVSPLIELWGFGTAFTADQIPQPDEIADALARTSHDYLALTQNQWCKSIDDLAVNLSATAKGYGVDKVAEYLQAEGLDSWLVEVGGELRASGHNAEGNAWRVGIEKPAENSSQTLVQGVIEITDAAVATSGDYRNFFEKDGQIYSHVIDPRSGYPVPHVVASVTVIHETTLWADGWATAMLAMGPETGMAMANALDIKVFMVIRDGESFYQQQSAAWQ